MLRKEENRFVARVRGLGAFAVAMAIQVVAVAQTGIPSPPVYDYVPPTPTAAAIQRYVDAPVNLSTGTPEISVPLYEINVGDFKLPITLSYHAGGHLVQDGASWVGFGWSLNVPGTISRAVRGREDDGTWGSFFHDWDGAMLDASNPEEYAKLVRLTQGITDGLPDLYSFNIPGYSGRFIIQNGGNVVMMPVQPLRIGSGSGGVVSNIAAADGTKFVFGKTEVSSTRSSTTASQSVTSYYMTKITTPAGKVIEFLYDKETRYQQSVNMSYSETYTRNVSTGNYQLQSSDANSFVTKVEGYALTSIVFPGGKVVFNSSNDRRDVIKNQGDAGDYRLNSMEVQDESGKVVKKIYFTQGYFNTTSTDPSALRLKLLGLEIGNGNEYPQTYSFTYNEQYQLPSRTSYSRDHWGYAIAHDQRIPPFDVKTGVVNTEARNADPERGKTWMLTRITYPTGGYTEYSYEPHDHYDPSESTVYVPREYTLEAPDLNPPPPDGDFYDPTVTKLGSIRINSNSRKVNLYVMIGEPEWHDPHGFMNVKLYYYDKNSVEQIAAFGNTKGDHGVSLSGDDNTLYYMRAEASVQNSWVRGILTFEEPVRNIITNPICGGIRVKRIVQYDGIDHAHDIIKNYSYRLASDPQKSSGILLIDEPDYTEDVHYFDNCIGELGVACEEFHAVRVSAQNLMPMGTGNHISYSEVTVTYGDKGENGKTRYTYTYAPNPSKENSDTNWRRGMLLTQTDWDANGNLLKSISNDYKVKPSSFQRFYGSLVTDLGKHKAASATEPSDAFPRYFGQHPAVMETEFQYMASQEEITYDPTDRSKYVRQFREFTYDSPSHLFVTQQTMLNSVPGEKVYTRFLYPQDYPEGTPFIEDMKTGYVVDKPIETVTYKTTPTGVLILSGNVTVFRAGGLPAEQWQLEASPLPALSAFRFSNQQVAGTLAVGTGNAVFSKDSRYKIKRTYDVYDDKNNLLQYTESSVPTTLRWGVQGTVITARASFARSEQIFYTSFEENGAADENARAGARSVNTPYTFVPPAGLATDAATELSYWAYTGGAWMLKRQAYTGGTITINEGTKIDELRVSPRGAQMSTYVYQPLVGIGWIFDPNQQVTYYDYNVIGQLMRIRDQQGNTVKAFSYHYNSQ